MYLLRRGLLNPTKSFAIEEARVFIVVDVVGPAVVVGLACDFREVAV